MTCPEEVEETIGISMEVEPLEHMKLEDFSLSTYSHDLFLSSREIPSVDESKPQVLPNFSPLDVNLGDKRGTDPPIKPHSPDSFRIKEVDSLTIYRQPSPHVAPFHLKDIYCYYQPCIDDPKKHYGFKPGLLGQSGSLGVDLLNLEITEDDWELESKELYFLGSGLNSPILVKKMVELENVLRSKLSRELHLGFLRLESSSEFCPLGVITSNLACHALSPSIFLYIP
ncbi:hypothetical protein Tco_1324819 [Tanacetum coccineum]